MDLSVIIPAFNEERNITDTLGSVGRVLEKNRIQYQLVAVDDGSQDNTGSRIQSSAESDRRIVSIRHERNRGIAGAFKTGVTASVGDWIILVPADLPMRPEAILDFWKERQDTDIVLGIRSDRRDSPLWRRIVSIANIGLIRLLFGMKQRQFNYVAMYRRQIFQTFHISSNSIFFHAEILIKARDAGFRIRELDAEYSPRKQGSSSSGRFPVIWAAFREMIGFYLQRLIHRNTVARSKPSEKP